jgi:4-alpha-glucanotransferase
MAESFEQLLERASSLFGIGSGFWDIWGRHHTTPAETKQALLEAMGMPAGDAESLRSSLEDSHRRQWSRIVAPAVVTDESSAPGLTLRVPCESLSGVAKIRVRREDGHVTETEVGLSGLQVAESVEIDGRNFASVLVLLPQPLPLGYHDVTVDLGGVQASTRYIVTPERAWTNPALGREGRAAGISISLYGVRSARNWGVGDFTDLLEVIDWVADELRAGFVGLNPLHAIHNRRPFNTSPYLPNCIFYQNFLYLDIEAIGEFARSRRAQALRRSPKVQAEIEELRQAPFVEYERAAALKLRFAKLLFADFLRDWRKQTPRAQEFRAFLAQEGELLEKFATYCALDECLHAENPNLWIWTEWPEAYRDPDSEETRQFRKKHWRRVLFYQYLQWQIDLQLRRAQERSRERQMPIGLYHDLALATDRFGSDLWAHRPFFAQGCRVGSPPDDFAPNGQDWGFPPPNAERHRENGYCLFAESIRRNCRHGGALRMDHVMRLFRLYWIPDGRDASHGAYVRETSEDFVRVLALESVRNRVMIVGEDLGTVEPEIREILSRFGILSYRLFYFEKNGDRFRKYEEYPPQALVSSTTHDLPTLAGFWIGADIEARRSTGILDAAAAATQQESRMREKQKMLDLLFEQDLIPAHLPRSASAYPELTGELHNAIVGFLARTPSQLLAINQEDLTKETAQQNLPGTTWQYPNWGRKMRYSLEQLRSDNEARGYTAMFRNWIIGTGRHSENRPDRHSVFSAQG